MEGKGTRGPHLPVTNIRAAIGLYRPSLAGYTGRALQRSKSPCGNVRAQSPPAQPLATQKHTTVWPHPGGPGRTLLRSPPALVGQVHVGIHRRRPARDVSAAPPPPRLPPPASPTLTLKTLTYASSLISQFDHDGANVDKVDPTAEQA